VFEAVDPANAFLIAEQVVYRYAGSAADGPPALDGVTLRVARGEHVALVGRNGSGKSTLARHFNALLIPQQGRVLVDGQDTRDRAAHRSIRDRVGMIFHNPDNQIIATTVGDDVAWGLMVRGMDRATIEARVAAALQTVGLQGSRDVAPEHLSGGQRQRLALAGILAVRPACIVADEATGLLDPRSRAEVVQLLAQLHTSLGITLVQVTHLLEETVFADRVVVLDAGKIVLAGRPGDVLAQPGRLRSLGVTPPDIAVLADALRHSGLPIPRDALTPAGLATAWMEAIRKAGSNGQSGGACW